MLDLENRKGIYNGAKAYPVSMKKDITAQLPYLLKKYLKHKDYQNQTIEDKNNFESL